MLSDALKKTKNENKEKRQWSVKAKDTTGDRCATATGIPRCCEGVIAGNNRAMAIHIESQNGAGRKGPLEVI